MQKVRNILNKIEVTNPKFVGSQFEEWSMTPATTKGTVGEEIAQAILEENGHEVSPRVSKEHDRIVDGKKVEIKTAFIKRDSEDFSFYGYDATEDPHWWLLQLVTPENVFLVKMDRVTMATVYLGRTRKNQMFTVTMQDLMDKGGVLMGSYYSKPWLAAA